MTSAKCGFSPEHYKLLLECALTGGYSFKGFGEKVVPGERLLYLRHDIDVTIELAVPMGRAESALGIRSTYFILPNSPFYSLLEPKTVRSVCELVDLGHRVGLHLDLKSLPVFKGKPLTERIERLHEIISCVYPLDEVVSFHIPGPDVLDKKLEMSLRSTYEPALFSEIKYLSDSNGIWREGCPCHSLAQSTYGALQILVHPVWWTGTGTPLQTGERVVREREAELVQFLRRDIPPFKGLLEKEGV